MDQIFGISRYEKQTKPHKNWEFQNEGSYWTMPSRIQTF